MRYYIRNEVLSALKMRGTYIYFAFIIILSLLANIAMIAFRTIYGMNEGSFGYNLIYFAEWCFIIPYYSTMLIADIIFGKECPNPRIKNKVTIGLSRTKLFLGKFFSQIFIAFCFFASAIICYLGITYLFMAADGTIELWMITDFLKAAFTAVPLWIAGISIANGFLFVFSKKASAYIAFYSVVLVIPRVIMFLAAKPLELTVFKFIKEYMLITPRFNELPYFATLDIPKITIIGSLYTVIFIVIGLLSYHRKEF